MPQVQLRKKILACAGCKHITVNTLCLFHGPSCTLDTVWLNRHISDIETSFLYDSVTHSLVSPINPQGKLGYVPECLLSDCFSFEAVRGVNPLKEKLLFQSILVKELSLDLMEQKTQNTSIHT